ncbi:MAG: TraR/DksA C4-type zinc finger protein [Deltaproteobacteria bacterium]|nr:TraR/DksA C4-type zinc finger protein [Deltaproteobacteria bacterium]
MTNEEREELKQILETQLQELISKTGSKVAGLVTSSVGAPEMVEQSSLDYSRSLSLRISDRESKLIRKIQQALDRMESEDYGFCDICGEDISTARLRARPVTTLCIACKTSQESWERASGF